MQYHALSLCVGGKTWCGAGGAGRGGAKLPLAYKRQKFSDMQLSGPLLARLRAILDAPDGDAARASNPNPTPNPTPNPNPNPSPNPNPNPNPNQATLPAPRASRRTLCACAAPSPSAHGPSGTPRAPQRPPPTPPQRPQLPPPPQRAQRGTTPLRGLTLTRGQIADTSDSPLNAPRLRRSRRRAAS